MNDTDPFGRRVDTTARDRIGAIADFVEAEAADNRRMRAAVIRFGDRTSKLAWASVALVIVIVVVAATGYDRLNALAHRNTDAIRVGCTLLANAVIQSGSGGQRNDTAAGKAQAELTRLAYIGISRSWTPAERARAIRLQAIIQKAGGVVATPDCDAVAEHPERVKALFELRTKVQELTTPPAPVRPNP